MHSPDPYLPGHGDTRYRVLHYDLELNYKVASNRLDERATLDVEILEPTSKIALDLYGLTADKVQLDGQRIKFRHNQRRLNLDIGHHDAGERFVVDLRVSGKPRPVPGAHGEAGWEELTAGSMVGSQPQGAPGWFPCNNDAANKATYRIEVICDANYTVIANGSLGSMVRVGGAKRWIYDMKYPMSPYLATLQIGNYAIERRPARKPAEIVAPVGLNVGAGTAFARQAEMLDFFSEVFGPYPFDEYRAVIVGDPLEIPLEAQGLSSFGCNFVSPTWDHERLVAHELAHQWFGNSVTSKTLSDIWLHEGFACYSEWLWSDYRSASVAGVQSVQQQVARHYPTLRFKPHGLTLVDPGMKNMFDDWVYKRGAITLHAIRCVLGDSVFFRMLQAWTHDYAYQTVTTADFMAHCERFSGPRAEQLRAVMEAWLFSPELPPMPVLAR